MAAIELNLNPDRRMLFQFGWIALAGFGALGGVVLWRGGLLGIDFGAAAPGIGIALWAIGGISGFLSLVAPRANRLLYVGLAVLTYPIGFVLSYAIMGVLFYGVFTPMGLLLRIARRDPLRRGFDSSASTYWDEAPGEEPAERYFKQY